MTITLRSWPTRPLAVPTTEHADCACWWCQRDKPKSDMSSTVASGLPRPANGLAGEYRRYVRQWRIDRYAVTPAWLRGGRFAAPPGIIQSDLETRKQLKKRPPIGSLVWTTDPQAKGFDSSNTLRWERALFDEARSPIVAFQGWLHSHSKLVPGKPDPRPYLVTGPWEAPTGWCENPGFGTTKPRRVTVKLDGDRGYLPHPDRRWSNDSLLEEYGMRSEMKELQVWSRAEKRWVWETREVFGWVHRDWRMRAGLDGHPPREGWFSRETPGPELHRSFTKVAEKQYVPDAPRVPALTAYVQRNNAHAKLLRQRDDIVTLLTYFGQSPDDPKIIDWLGKHSPVEILKTLNRRFHEQRAARKRAAEAEPLSGGIGWQGHLYDIGVE